MKELLGDLCSDELLREEKRRLKLDSRGYYPKLILFCGKQ